MQPPEKLHHKGQAKVRCSRSAPCIEGAVGLYYHQQVSFTIAVEVKSVNEILKLEQMQAQE